MKLYENDGKLECNTLIIKEDCVLIEKLTDEVIGYCTENDINEAYSRIPLIFSPKPLYITATRVVFESDRRQKK